MKNKKYAVLGIFAVLAAVLLIFGANLQSQSKATPQMQLGGGFIGSDGVGTIFDALQVPLDPNGRRAALHLKFHTWNDAIAGLLAGSGSDTLTEATGQIEMTGRDTFEVGWIAYATNQGTPRLIIVYNGAAQFTGPDSYVIEGTFKIYLNFGPTKADADGDGFPDEGKTPIQTTTTTVTAKRVPIP